MAAPPEVRTHVTFKATRFNQTEVQPHFINPGCFGEDCARWLVAELRQRGWADVAEPWQEDWGWQTGGQRGARTYRINVGLIPEEDEPEWLIHVEEHVGLWTRLRGAAGPSVLGSLTDAIHASLRAVPDVWDVRWHWPDLFLRGQSDGVPEPTTPRTADEVAV